MHRRKAMIGRYLVPVTLLMSTLFTTSAQATPFVKLRASFVPYTLNASTTIKFGFNISTDTGALPPPLAGVDLHLPAGINQNAAELGLDICRPADLRRIGANGCPANSRVGLGTAHVEAMFGGQPVREAASVIAFAGPTKTSSELLFYQEAKTPIASQLIYSGRARNDSAPFGGELETTVPLVPTVPGGSYLTTVDFRSTLGPLGLTYFRKVRGRLEPFHPGGVFLPKKCPVGGFPFRVDLTFGDGTAASDETRVPCPLGSGKSE